MTHIDNKIPRLFDLEKMEKKPTFSNGLAGKDILSVDQFDRDLLSYIFGRADEMRELVEKVGACDLLHGAILTCLFYEPSTRTSVLLHRRHGTAGRRGHPHHPGRTVQLGRQGRKPARYHPHPAAILRRDRAAPPRDRLGQVGRRSCQRAGDQRR